LSETLGYVSTKDKKNSIIICNNYTILRFVKKLRGCLGLLRSTFFSSAPRFSAKQFQLHALCSRKNSGVVRAPKEVLHKLQFFVKLLHGGVCGAEFVEQSQTPPKQWIFSCFKHVPIITKLCSAKLISASSKNLSISSVQI